MNSEQFEKVLVGQIERINNVLGVKAGEYATEDRLYNFKVAAELQDQNPKQALAGMMAKHTVSVYDMARSEKAFSREQWDEKITDHINYLILLRAIVEEEKTSQEDVIKAYADGKNIMTIVKDANGVEVISDQNLKDTPEAAIQANSMFNSDREWY